MGARLTLRVKRWPCKIDWNGRWAVSDTYDVACILIKVSVEDDAPIDDDESGSKTMMIRVTEFYGLGCEEWLNLVIKVCFSYSLDYNLSTDDVLSTAAF